MSRSTTLYRLRDDDGVLLYVGISQSVMRRLHEHGAGKTWWRDVVSVDIEHFAERSDAVAAEWRAIGTENPLHNIDRRHATTAGAYPPNPGIAAFMAMLKRVADADAEHVADGVVPTVALGARLVAPRLALERLGMSNEATT